MPVGIDLGQAVTGKGLMRQVGTSIRNSADRLLEEGGSLGVLHVDLGSRVARVEHPQMGNTKVHLFGKPNDPTDYVARTFEINRNGSVAPFVSDSYTSGETVSRVLTRHDIDDLVATAHEASVRTSTPSDVVTDLSLERITNPPVKPDVPTLSEQKNPWFNAQLN